MIYRAPLKLANYQKIILKDGRIVVMHRIGISLVWYNAVKDLVTHGAPYFYYENYFDGKEVEVEVEVEVKVFNRVSKELGWML